MSDNVVVVTPSPLLVAGSVAGPQGPTGTTVIPDSPAFTGNPTAPTPAVADNDTSLATTAFVGLRSRVTHPNTDDVLVQVWDVAQARWQNAHYDSGIRSFACSSLIGAAWSGTLYLRRVNQYVHISADTTGTAVNFPGLVTGLFGGVGFRPLRTNRVPFATFNNSSGDQAGVCIFTAGSADATCQRSFGGSAWSAGQNSRMFLELIVACEAALPSSLPGTLVSAAPYA